MNFFKNKPLRFYIGHILMLFSTLILVGIYFPLISLYLNPPKIKANFPSQSGYYLTIPKIQAQSEIIPNVDPFNQKEYRHALEKGIAHAKNTGNPGEGKTIYLFAHSSDSPWTITRQNTIFLKLDQLKPGDDITINKDGQVYNYKVRETKIVQPSEINYLLETSQNQLILQTCTPIGTALKRLLVFANPL